MSQVGYTPILIYASGTPGNTPSAANLTSNASGAELAINYADGKLFYKDSGGAVQILAVKMPGGILPIANGGTNSTATPTAGAVAYGTGTAYAFTAAGSSGQVLTSAGAGTPTWTSLSSIGVTTFSAGTTGFTPNSATSGAITLAGTLATTNGGTGLTSFTANGVVYASSTSALTTGSALTFDGSQLGVGTASGTSNGLKLNAGNAGANYVLYRDGTTGLLQVYGNQSGFNGLLISGVDGQQYLTDPAKHVWSVSNVEQMRLTSTGLGIGTSSPGDKLHIVGTGTNAGAGYLVSRFMDSTNTKGVFLGYDTDELAGTIYGVNFLTFQTFNGSAWGERMRLDASGNLGLGVTPSAWASGWTCQQVGYSYSLMTASVSTAANAWYQMNNAYYDGSFKYKNNGFACSYEQGSGTHIWKTAPSGTAGNAISFTQVMTLDASGNLGIGTTSPGVKLDVDAGNPTVVNFGGVTTTGQSSGVRFRTGSTKTAWYVGAQNNVNNVFEITPSTAAGGTTFSTPAIQIDSSGNLGLGVTPNAWSTYKAFQVGNGSLFNGTVSSTDYTILASNAYTDTASSYKYIGSNYATAYYQFGGKHAWFNAPSGTAGNAITFTQAMTLDENGNLGIGTTSTSGYKLVVSDGTTYSVVHAGGGASYYGAISNSPVLFITNNTERMRLDSSGNLGLGVTPSTWYSTYRALQISSNGSFSTNTDFFATGNNYYTDATATEKFLGSGYALKHRTVSSSGRYEWHVSTASGTAGNAITFTQAMTLDASGNLLVGLTATTDSERVRIDKTTGSSDFSSNSTLFLSSGSANTTANLIRFNGAVAKGLVFGRGINADNFVWGFTNSTTPVMTLDSSGNLLVGTTTFGQPDVNGAAIGPADGAFRSHHATGTASGTIHAYFTYGGLGIGSITQNGTTAVAYNTTSDYRLKDNQQPLTNSGAFIDALQPKTWTWKADGSKGVGFIAHEVQAVSPGSVVGEKDAVDEEGKPKYQAMEYGSAEFIANIIAELQSLRARVAALESKP